MTENKAPAIVGKAKEERKAYFFRNCKAPGGSVTCFMGNAPRPGQSRKETITQHTMRDGQVVHLTESEAEHIRTRGIEKPVTEEGPGGSRRATGQTFLDRRFELHQA